MRPFPQVGQATLTVVLLSLLLTACASPPQNAIDSATNAMASADSVEAARYAPDLYQAAMDSMAVAQQTLEAENNKFAINRSYTAAGQQFAAVAQTATRAAAEAIENKAAMQAEVSQVLASLPTRLRTLNQRITQAQNRRATRAAAEEAKAMVADVNTLLGTARTALESGDIAAAHASATQAQDKVNAASTRLG